MLLRWALRRQDRGSRTGFPVSPETVVFIRAPNDTDRVEMSSEVEVYGTALSRFPSRMRKAPPCNRGAREDGSGGLRFT